MDMENNVDHIFHTDHMAWVLSGVIVHLKPSDDTSWGSVNQDEWKTNPMGSLRVGFCRVVWEAMR